MAHDTPGKNASPPGTQRDESAGPVVDTPVNARQGRRGLPVLMVLVASLALAVIAGFLLGFI